MAHCERFPAQNVSNNSRSEPFLQPYIEDGKNPTVLKLQWNSQTRCDIVWGTTAAICMDEAQRAARQCDLMLVAGSSLEVLPVAGLPMQALDRGAHLIIINNTPTYLNVRADVVIMDDVATILP